MPEPTSADQTFPSGQPEQSEDSARDEDVHAPDDESRGKSDEVENSWTDDERDGHAESDAGDDIPGHTRLVIPGPGIPEALLWMIGMLCVHMMGMVIAMTVIVVNHLSTLPSPPTSQRQLLMEVQGILRDQTQALNLITGEMAFFLVIAVIATAVRLGRRSGRRLGLTRMSAAHLTLIVAVSIPLSLMCGAFHHVTTEVWNDTLGDLPIFDVFRGMDVNETLKPLGESAPLWLLLAVIAVAPAIGEEVIFRGVIGRGLIARYGVLAGVVMTSLMFAAVHIHPAHVIALLPLAFFIHLVYVATRSFWAPVLLHLLNNSLAAVLLRLSGSLEGSDLDDEAGMSLPLIAISATVVVMAAVSLWKSRVEYRHSDGSTWDPGYSSVEMPPSDVAAFAVHRNRPASLFGLTLMLATLYSAIFIATLVQTLSPAV